MTIILEYMGMRGSLIQNMWRVEPTKPLLLPIDQRFGNINLQTETNLLNTEAEITEVSHSYRELFSIIMIISHIREKKLYYDTCDLFSTPNSQI